MNASYTAPQSPISTPDLLSQFRVRTVAEILDVAFRAYRRNFLTFLLIILITAIPLQLLSYVTDIFVFGRYEQPDFTGFSGSSSFSSRVAVSSTLSQIGAIKDYFETYLLYIAQWAITAAIVSAIYGGVVTLRSAYGAVRDHFGRALGLMGLQILITLGIYSPMILALALASSGADNILFLVTCLSPICSLAYLIIDVRLKVALPAAVVENLTPREAIRRSFNLTRNYWWRTLGLVIVLNILSAIIVAGPAALVTALFGLGLQGIYATLAVTRLVGILTTAIFAPVEMGAVAFYYYDQRVRREGFDLETAIEGRYVSGAYGPSPPPPPEYKRDTAQSYSSYGQPTFGYNAPPSGSSETSYFGSPINYGEPTDKEPSRVRRVAPSNAPATPETPSTPESPEANS